MATIPKKPNPLSTPNSKKTPIQNPKPSLIPPTPQPLPPLRRSSRLTSSPDLPLLSSTPIPPIHQTPNSAKNVRKRKIGSGSVDVSLSKLLSPVSPDRSEARKRKKCVEENSGTTRMTRVLRNVKRDLGVRKKKRVYYRRVVYDGGEFSVGDNVYVKRREEASSDEEDPETEECRVCFKAGRAVMIECDDCLGGFHLKCLKPPLRVVPEGDWVCGYCEARKLGKDVELPSRPEGKKRVRTAREKLLSSDLWAVHIERYDVV